MSDSFAAWLVRALATDAPLLPALALQQIWLHLGWAVVLAWLGSTLVRWCRASCTVQAAVAAALAVWACVPGALGASFWLGLAFQAPSLTMVVLCAVLGVRRLSRCGCGHPSPSTAVTVPRLPAVLLGWALLLDSFAVLPWQLYAWGFSPLVPAVVVVVALLPWVAGSRGATGWPTWVVLLVAMAFVVLRLPSGNAWDALLDPWLWLALQGQCLRWLWAWLRP